MAVKHLLGLLVLMISTMIVANMLRRMSASGSSKTTAAGYTKQPLHRYPHTHVLTSSPENSSWISTIHGSMALKPSITFPHSSAVRPIEQILTAPWIRPLQTFLLSLSSKQVTLVTADSKFLPNLLNWLISALVKVTPAMNDILVLALDEPLQAFLQSKDLPSVFINPQTVVQPGTEMQSNFSHIWITRCVVFRLINYWGFDVLSFDVDAIVLKNIQPILDENRDADAIGSFGVYPFRLHRQWGVTFCMGVALFRSSEYTELLWETVSQVAPDSMDDQVKFNSALERCHISWQWKTAEGCCTIGLCQNGFKVAILPTDVVCRVCKLKKVKDYYIWHHHGPRKSKDKIERAQLGNAWFLRDDWNSSYGNMTGAHWLSDLSI